MFPTLPNDVSLIIACASGPLWSLANLMRVSRAWRATLAAHVARVTDTAVFYERLRGRMRSCLNDCKPADTTVFVSISLRTVLQEESAPRFASLALFLERYADAFADRHRSEGGRFRSLCVLLDRLNEAFVASFTRRGVMRNFITMLRHERRINQLDELRDEKVARVERKRRLLQNSEAALKSADKRRRELTEKKRKLEEKLGAK